MSKVLILKMSVSVDGFVPRRYSQRIVLLNDSGNTMTLVWDGAGGNMSAAANRIRTVTGANVDVDDGGSATLVYSQAAAMGVGRWFITSNTM